MVSSTTSTPTSLCGPKKNEVNKSVNTFNAYKYDGITE